MPSTTSRRHVPGGEPPEDGRNLEPREPLGALEGVEALGLGVARGWRGGAKAAKVHACDEREDRPAEYRGNAVRAGPDQE